MTLAVELLRKGAYAPTNFSWKINALIIAAGCMIYLFVIDAIIIMKRHNVQ